MISDDLVQKITDLWKNATGKIRYDKPVLSVFFDGNGDPQFVSSANPLPTSGGAGGGAIDYETPYITFACNTVFTGASVGDIIAGILTIDTTTNTLVSNTPVWYNFTTSLPLTVVDTSKLTAIASNSLTAAQLSTMTLAINLDKIGGSALTYGTKTAATSIPVTLASDGVASLALGTTADSAATSGTGNWSMIALLKGIITSLQSSLLFKNTPLTSETASNIASSATNVTLLSANANRRSLSIFNDSTAVLYIKFGATASTSSYKLQIAAGGYYEMPQPAYPGQIDGIWASANGNARISEGV
jgi:hypothetical protein